MGTKGEGESQVSQVLTNHDFPHQGPWLRALGLSQTSVRTPRVSPLPMTPVSLGRVAPAASFPVLVAPVVPVAPAVAPAVAPVGPVALASPVAQVAPAVAPVAQVASAVAPAVAPADPVLSRVVLQDLYLSQEQGIPRTATPLGLALVYTVAPAPPSQAAASSRGLDQLYQPTVVLPTS